LAQARLKIVSPESLVKEFKDGLIQAEYANFGYIPYGQTIMGRMHYYKDNANACEEFDLEEKHELERSADLSPFFFAKRGDCSFVQKVRNMENVGVAVGIIMDSTFEEPSHVAMADDGTGGGIRIPSMLISKQDGQSILNWLQKASTKDQQNIVLMAEFVQDANE
jgi:hypothetical protein